MIKLSKASKMPCRSWSLQALDTCPASKDENGELVPACQGCYATTGNYHFPNVKAPREHNKEDWQRSDWVDDMIAELDNDRYFRWFDSGDMYALKLAEKIYQVCKATPWTRHWIPTRMHKFPKFKKIIDKMNKLDNVVVRLSSDGINGEIIEGAKYSSTIIPKDAKTKIDNICMAYENEGKCGKCRLCWSKEVPIVAYIGHGVSMEKQQKLLIETLQIA